MITTEEVKALRDETGVSIMQCKKALEEAQGDIEKAKVLLRKQSSVVAEKKAGRTLGAGALQAYIHSNNKVGAIVQLSCETDFVAKNEEFVALAYDIAMQVAAQAPRYQSREDVNESAMKKVKEVLAKEVKDKPQAMQDKILAGKLDAYFKDTVLLEQTFIKDPNSTIEDLIHGATQKFGERIEIVHFARYAIQ